MITRNTGTHGMSSMVSMPGPVRKLRSTASWRRTWVEPTFERSRASTTIADSSNGPIRRSIQRDTRTKAKPRTLSSAACTPSATAAIIKSRNRVVELRLASTRSNTWYMNSGIVNISRLTKKLNTPHAPNAV
jgi:hypothetical protein